MTGNSGYKDICEVFFDKNPLVWKLGCEDTPPPHPFSTPMDLPLSCNLENIT